MEKKLQPINFKDFVDYDVKSIEIFSESLAKIILDSIINKSTESIHTSIEPLTHSYEKIFNALNLNDAKNLVCYYFGRISSLTDLSLDLSDYETANIVLKNISKNYSLLLPALMVIDKHGTVSGAKLKKELKFKSDSNLSNFIKRIKKYNLIEVNKIGTSNFYTLSLLGKRLLDNQCKKTSSSNDRESSISLRELLYFLNGILEEIEEEKPNTLNIIHNYVKFPVTISEKRLIKQKLDSIFYLRNKYISDLIQNNANTFRIEENNDMLSNYNYSKGDDTYEYDHELISVY